MPSIVNCINVYYCQVCVYVFLVVRTIAITITNTAKNTVISPNFLVWKFCGKAQFPHSYGRFVRNYAETLPFHKISTPENQVKSRYFWQCTVTITIMIIQLLLLFILKKLRKYFTGLLNIAILAPAITTLKN